MTDPFAPPPPTPEPRGVPQPAGTPQPAGLPQQSTPPSTAYPPPAEPFGGYDAPSGYSTPYAQGPYASTPYAQSPYAASPYPSSPYPSAPYGTYGPGAVPPGTDGISIAALVAGLVGLGPVPLVLGIVGARRTSRSGQAGKGLAIAGIVLGALQVLIGIVVIALVIVLGVRGSFDEATTEPGTYYGDNAMLDRLWDACDEGDMASCDELYDRSEQDSDYSLFGLTCGDRSSTGDYCTTLEFGD